jgi:hypothetical protein
MMGLRSRAIGTTLSWGRDDVVRAEYLESEYDFSKRARETDGKRPFTRYKF